MSDPPWKKPDPDPEPPAVPDLGEIPEVEPDYEFERVTQEDGYVEIRMKDIHALVCEANAYCRKNDDCVLIYEDPRNLVWGLITAKKPGMSWLIRLPEIRKSLKRLEAKAGRLRKGVPPSEALEEAARLERLATIYRKYIRTRDGRVGLAVAASSRKPATSESVW